MSEEYYKKERPKTIKGIVGNAGVKSLLESYAADPTKMPHSILLTGPSGTGKTTVGRIICSQILEVHSPDLIELNCAEQRGIEMVRDITEQMRKSPRRSKYRAWVIDEAHMITKAAQEAFLKILEDTPSHVYFFIATTEPNSLIAAIKTRCTQIALKALPDAAILKYLESIVAKYKLKLADDVLDEIIEVSEGSLRKALVLLDQVGRMEQKHQKDAVRRSDTKAQTIELCRELLKPKPSWAELIRIIGSIDDEPESARRMVLGYMASCAKTPKLAPRCLRIMDCFRDNYYDTGRAGLTISCGSLVFDE